MGWKYWAYRIRHALTVELYFHILRLIVYTFLYYLGFICLVQTNQKKVNPFKRIWNLWWTFRLLLVWIFKDWWLVLFLTVIFILNTSVRFFSSLEYLILDFLGIWVWYFIWILWNIGVYQVFGYEHNMKLTGMMTNDSVLFSVSDEPNVGF